MTRGQSSDELRQSVATYRKPETTDAERQAILERWRQQNIPNQFAAMMRAAGMDKGRHL